MGAQAIELNLGCDCLGHIHDLPGAYVAHDGSSVVIKNAIRIHEEDAGIIWKHNDFRPGGRSQHYSSGHAVGYSVSAKGGAVRLLAGEGGWAWKRARFATKALWVVKDVESEKGGRLWPAGKYVPQTRNEPEDSVSRWVQGEDSIENEDIVLFITIGTTHIPRPEDWPVMPAEHLRLMFKPSHFFATNPSMDVPGTKDAQSVAAFPNKKSEASHSG